MVKIVLASAFVVVTFLSGPAVASSPYGGGKRTQSMLFPEPDELAHLRSVKDALVSGRLVVLRHETVAMSDLHVGVRAFPVAVDDTLSSVRLDLHHPGAPGDVSLSLFDPAGARTSTAVRCRRDVSAVRCLGRIGSPLVAGTYRLRVRASQGAPQAGAVSLTAFATPRLGGTYHLVVTAYGDGAVAYPEPVEVRATVLGEAKIAGLRVEARVFDRVSGAPVGRFALRDDGEDADRIGDDGTYMGVYHYRRDGDFEVQVHADNFAGTGWYTTLGELSSIRLDGTAQDPWAEHTPVDAVFSRFASADVRVTGVRADDHADAGPGRCTAVEADNRDVWGRVDRAGDVDCFTLVWNDAEDFFVRAVYLTDGMDPLITVYGSDGERVIATGGVAVSLSHSLLRTFAWIVKGIRVPSTRSQWGAVVRLDEARVDPAGMVVTVRHRDAGARKGNYAFSAGPQLPSDVPNW